MRHPLLRAGGQTDSALKSTVCIMEEYASCHGCQRNTSLGVRVGYRKHSKRGRCWIWVLRIGAGIMGWLGAGPGTRTTGKHVGHESTRHLVFTKQSIRVSVCSVQ